MKHAGRRIAVSIFVLAILRTSVSQGKPVVYDNFETVPTTWSFRQYGTGGSQAVSDALAHEGRYSLYSETDRLGLTNIRRGFRYRDKCSGISFWYYADFDQQDSPDTALTIALRSESDQRLYWTRMLGVQPREWRYMTLRAADVSPLVQGDWIGELCIGVRGKVGPFRLYLDEVRIDNHTRGQSSATEAVAREHPKTGGSAALPWLPCKEPTVRAALVSPGQTSLDPARVLVGTGINLFIVLRPSEAELVHWVGVGEMVRVPVFAVLPLFPAVADATVDEGLRPAVFADGLPERTACPLDDLYWSRYVSPSLARWTELSKVIPLRGILLDLNLDARVHPSYTVVDSCFCAECFSRYLKSIGLKETIDSFPERERYHWLRAHRAVLHYHEILEREIESVMASSRGPLYAINPNLVWGIFKFQHNWLARGLLKAMGVSGGPTPMVVAAEPTAEWGYSIAVAWDSQRLTERGIAHRWLPGFSLSHFTAKEVSQQLQVAGRRSHGYWLDSADAFFGVNGNRTQKLKSPVPAMWEALRQANHQLQSQQASQAKQPRLRHKDNGVNKPS